jgi:hypothetical protein
MTATKGETRRLWLVTPAGKEIRHAGMRYMGGGNIRRRRAVTSEKLCERKRNLEKCSFYGAFFGVVRVIDNARDGAF